MRQVRLNLYPSGTGYRFIELDGSKHKADGWRQLEKKIIAYRARNGKEPGDPWTEIMTQACAGNPGICYDDQPRVPVQPPEGGKNYSSTIFPKISSWLGELVSKLRRKQVEYVGRQEATRRAAICAKCPKQMGIPTVCGACISQLSNLRRVVIQGQEPVNKGLQACSSLGEDTQVSVHLMMEPKDVDGQPDFCWRRSM